MSDDRSDERWVPMPGFGNWEVSDHGRFRRGGAEYACVVSYKKNKGRRYVEMRDGDKRLRCAAAAAILTAFVGPRPAGHFAVHKDDDTNNEHLSNLEWALPAVNSAQAVANGKIPRGSDNPIAELDEVRVAEILSKISAGATKKGLAREYGVSDFSIREIVSGKRWAHVPRPAGFEDKSRPVEGVQIGDTTLSIAGWARLFSVKRWTLEYHVRQRGPEGLRKYLVSQGFITPTGERK